jgi:hypothetical protein
MTVYGLLYGHGQGKLAFALPLKITTKVNDQYLTHLTAAKISMTQIASRRFWDREDADEMKHVYICEQVTNH